MNDLICEAISSRKVIEFNYNGGVRVVEPHCHGISRAGNEVLRGYQTDGYSESGNSVGWKMFEVSGMSIVQSTGDVFDQNRPGYNPDDKHMTSIHCHV